MSKFVIFPGIPEAEPFVLGDSPEVQAIEGGHEPSPSDAHDSFSDLSVPEIASLTIVGLAIGFAAIGGLILRDGHHHSSAATEAQDFTEHAS